jgi:NAD(P)H-hydrate epimerase
MRYIVHCDGCDTTSVVAELDRCPDCGARLGGEDVMMTRRDPGEPGEVEGASTEAMREAERLAADAFGIDPWSLMQEAGYRVADVVRRQYDRDEMIAVVTGPGNNGGDGLVAAARLAGWGYDVAVVAGTRELQGPAGKALERLDRTDVPILDEVPDPAVCVDAVFGYGLDGVPRSPYDELIRAMQGMPVVAVDVPSGVDADTGDGVDPHVVPDETVMLGLAKQGLDVDNAGELWLADIGLPGAVYEAVGARMPFGERSLLSL